MSSTRGSAKDLEEKPNEESAPTEARPGGALSAVGYYYPTVFVTGAAIMVIELLGARILAPYYGTSLFVWSSLITITLVALAIGYWLGGYVADRAPRAQILYTVIALAGVTVALVAPLRGPVLEATDALGLRAGSLMAAFVLFTTPLLLLGMVSPYAVKLSTQDLGKLARTAGRLYAVSTFGSFVGTLGAGFVLIPTFEVRTILVLVSAVLVAVSLLFFALYGRRWLGSALVALLALAVVFIPGARGTTSAGDIAIAARLPSFYGEIRVVDMGPLRFLLIDGGVQSAIDVRNGLGAVEYPYTLTTLAYRARPKGERALVVGLGAGLIPGAMEHWGVRSDMIEIDPKIVSAAIDHFGFESSEDVHVGDGRRFLEETDERYDYVALDAFAGEMVPVHLLSREAFAAAREVMEPGGVLLLNYVGYREGRRSRVAASIRMTLESAFRYVRTFEAGESGEYGGNIFVASDSPIDLEAEPPGAPLPFPVHEIIREHATAIRPTTLASDGAIVFTDDHNPVDLWDIEGRERWRRDTMKFFPSWVLLD